MAHYKLIANLKTAQGTINNGFVDHVEDGGLVFGWIEDTEGNRLGSHTSSTLQWLEHDLLGKVPFNREVDTYEKNW